MSGGSFKPGELLYVDRMWLHKRQWNCHYDCVPVKLVDMDTEDELKALRDRIAILEAALADCEAERDSYARDANYYEAEVNRLYDQLQEQKP